MFMRKCPGWMSAGRHWLHALEINGTAVQFGHRDGPRQPELNKALMHAHHSKPSARQLTFMYA
jgi:hypothetical protein